MENASVPAHIPVGYHSITPSLTVKDGKAALEFYTKAFGAVEHFRFPDPQTGGVAHAEFSIGNSNVMLSDEYPDSGAVAPKVGEGTLFMVYVPDVEEAFLRAINAGVTVIYPPTDQPWGDRAARVADPHGYRWTLAQRVREVSLDDLRSAMGA